MFVKYQIIAIVFSTIMKKLPDDVVWSWSGPVWEFGVFPLFFFHI
jgi:hypothetical protein